MVEVGVGTGLNLPHYPERVRRVRAVIREEHFDPRAEARARENGRALELLRGDAHALPLETASVDTLVCTFMLCSVDDPALALREFARVLRSGGQLLLAEHVRSPRALELAAQRTLTPLHRHWACGCRLDRDLALPFAAAGLELSTPLADARGVLPFPARELLSGVRRRAAGPAAASPRGE